MDKVLKQRLIGASILIALAVIFVPMLFDAPDEERHGREMTIELPQAPADRAQVRRLPLDPDQARRLPPETPPETQAPAPEPFESGPAREAMAAELPPPHDAEPEVDREALAEEEIVLLEAEPPISEVADVEPPPVTEPAREVAAPAAAPEPERTTEGWLVQVASFGSETTAREILARLSSLGHVSSIDPLVRGDMTLHRVVTGPYPSREDAERARGQIARTVAGVEPTVRMGSVPISDGSAEREQFAAQLGSFASRTNADRLVAQLAGEDFPAFIHEDSSGGRSIWRVRVGPYGSRAQAERSLTEIGERLGLEGLIVSHP